MSRAGSALPRAPRVLKPTRSPLLPAQVGGCFPPPPFPFSHGRGPIRPGAEHRSPGSHGGRRAARLGLGAGAGGHRGSARPAGQRCPGGAHRRGQGERSAFGRAARPGRALERGQALLGAAESVAELKSPGGFDRGKSTFFSSWVSRGHS